MGILADVKAGPVANVDSITDHVIDRLRAALAEAAQQLGPEAAVVGAALEKAVKGALAETLAVGEALEDHAAPLGVQWIREFFACLWRTRIDFSERK